MTDPTGQCFLLCAVIGAGIGAIVDYGAQVVGNIQQNGFKGSDFTNVNGGQILLAAGTGALIGATGGLAFFAGAADLGLTSGAATLATDAGIGGFSGAATSFVTGVFSGVRGNSLLHQTIVGGVAGAFSGAIGNGINAYRDIAFTKILMNAFSQGLLSAGSSVVDDLWNGKSINKSQIGYNLLNATIASLFGSYGAYGLNWSSNINATFDGTIQGLSGLWSSLVWSENAVSSNEETSSQVMYDETDRSIYDENAYYAQIANPCPVLADCLAG